MRPLILALMLVGSLGHWASPVAPSFLGGSVVLRLSVENRQFVITRLVDGSCVGAIDGEALWPPPPATQCDVL